MGEESSSGPINKRKLERRRLAEEAAQRAEANPELWRGGASALEEKNLRTEENDDKNRKQKADLRQATRNKQNRGEE